MFFYIGGLSAHNSSTASPAMLCNIYHHDFLMTLQLLVSLVWPTQSPRTDELSPVWVSIKGSSTFLT